MSVEQYTIPIGSLFVEQTVNDVKFSFDFYSNGVLQETGSAEITIYDTEGVALEGVTWPVACTHVSGGRWAGVVGKELEWPTDRLGEAIVTATDDGGNVRTMPLQVRFARL